MPAQNSEAYFDSELKEWSDRKLNLLQKYLDPFVKILGSTYAGNDVYYVDGFAGAGIYGDGAKGSPLRAAELAQEYEQAGKQYRLKCINVEANPTIFANLQTNTRDFASVTNMAGEFSQVVDTVLAQIGSNPALFFLDPFGIKGIDWETVAKIAARRSPTDLWIRFDYQIAFRLAGFYGKEDARAESNLDLLSKTYGISDRNFLYQSLQGSNSVQENKQNAVALYAAQLERVYRQKRRFGFSAPYLIRSLEGQEKYFLVFATGHPKGATLASETVCGIEETYEREVEEYNVSATSQLTFDLGLKPTADQIFHSKVSRLKESIWLACRGEISISRIEIYVRILKDWFGKLTSSHVNHALRELKDKDDGRIVDASGRLSADSTLFMFRS